MVSTLAKLQKVKLLLMLVLLCLITILTITGCNNTQTLTPDSASTEYSQSIQISKTVYVPMWGVHIESFNFNQGESIAGRFTVNGSYPISFSIVYYEEIGRHIEEGSGTEVVETARAVVFEAEDKLSDTFTFVAPKTADYQFWFQGKDIDELKGLSEQVTLELTVHPSR